MKKATYILTAVSYIILLSFVIRNLDTDTLWYDEAGQFFIAKGLNHFSPPFSPEGNIADVIYNNKYYNLDPGGFSILLHFWSMVSNNHIWLRLLPFIFFILTIIYTYKVIFAVSKDKLYSLIGGIMTFLLTQSYLLRAYSMELFCTIYGLWVILNIKDCTNKKLLLYSIILSMLITARYSTIMIVFGYSLYIVYLILKSKESLKDRLVKICIYVIPLTIMVLLIYLISMRIQNAHAEPLSYITYFKDDILGMFNKYHITLYLFIIIILVLRKRFNNEFMNIFYPFCIIEFMFIGLSIAGMQPCDLMGNKNTPLLLLYILCIYLSLYKLITQLKNDIGYPSTLLALCFLITFATLRMGGGPLLNSEKKSIYKTSSNLETINLDNYKYIYVSYWYSATIRYLYEYDSFSKDLHTYRSKFIFGDGYIHNTTNDNNVAEREKLAIKKENDIIKNLPAGTLIITSNIANYKDSKEYSKLEGCDEIYVKN